MAVTPRRLRHTENTEVWDVRDDTRTRYVKIVFDPDLDTVTAFTADHKAPWVSTGERYDSFEEARSANGLPELDDDTPHSTTPQRLTLTPKALSRWVWMRGQAWTDGCGAVGTVHRVNTDGLIVIFAGEHAAGMQRVSLAHSVPDLTDEVTALSLPAVVRKAWGDPTACSCANPLAGMWVVIVFVNGRTQRFTASNETEAWIAALEAAP